MDQPMAAHRNYGRVEYSIYVRSTCFCAGCVAETQVQRNFSIVDTTGTQLAVLYREVSLIQR